jgi:hypothetical protein
MDAAALQDAEDFVAGLNRCFKGLKDPRVEGRCRHLLSDIVVISLLAVLSGAEDFPDIEEFGKRREDWLREFLERNRSRLYAGSRLGAGWWLR